MANYMKLNQMGFSVVSLSFDFIKAPEVMIVMNYRHVMFSISV